MTFKFILVLVLLTVNYVHCEFSLQYLGNYVTSEEEEKREFCVSDQCLFDSNILFYAATQNASVSPCDDFKEFAVGTFYKYRALNDRYESNGFLRDLEQTLWEKQRKALSSKIDESDERVIKILKNFFELCRTSDFVRQNGTKEFFQLLDSLGGSLYLNGPSWNQSQFSLSKLFYEQGYHSMRYLLDHVFVRCPHPDNETMEILCFELRPGKFIN